MPARPVAVRVTVKLYLHMHHVILTTGFTERWGTHWLRWNNLIKLTAMILHPAAIEAVKHGCCQFHICHLYSISPEQRAGCPQEIKNWHEVRIMCKVWVADGRETEFLNKVPPSSCGSRATFLE
eukprot:11745519-Karenia_brevis.AAC.1